MQWIKRLTTQRIGQQTEQLAAQYLRQQGLVCLTHNFASKYGEIDIIAQDGDVLVFVEVKYRKHANYGGAIAAVAAAKQQKLKLCASFYLQQARLNEYNTPCRFDVVALQGAIEQPNITWLKNAF